MGAAQRLIRKALGADLNYQSVLNSQRNIRTPFQPVNQEHIQLLHDGLNHWILSSCSSSRVKICESLNSTLNGTSKNSVQALYRHFADSTDRVPVTFLPIQKQNDGCNYGVFAIVFAAEILDGESTMDAVFDVTKMRRHLMQCLEKQMLTPLFMLGY